MISLGPKRDEENGFSALEWHIAYWVCIIRRQILAKINADNADIIITADDLQMHIKNLISAPKEQNEIKNTSKEDLAKWVDSLKEKKK